VKIWGGWYKWNCPCWHPEDSHGQFSHLQEKATSLCQTKHRLTRLVATHGQGSTSRYVKLNGGLQQPLLKRAPSHPASQRNRVSAYPAPAAVPSAAGVRQRHHKAAREFLAHHLKVLGCHILDNSPPSVMPISQTAPTRRSGVFQIPVFGGAPSRPLIVGIKR
jgi:hypothetical protein